MAGPLFAERAPVRLAGWAWGLVIVSVAASATWPAFRDTLAAGGSAAVAPFFRRAGARQVPGPRAPSRLVESPMPSDRLATLARRMEFRVRRYRMTPALMQAWLSEWGCTPVEKLQLLRLLLGQLPEAAAKETPAPQRQDLFQCVLSLSAELRRADPSNGFPWLAESLALLHSGQEAPAMLALGEALRSARADAGLRALNASELALWAQRLDPWTLFPPMPRRWGLESERPLQNLGRSLSLQQRTFLKKYNIEKANEFALTQIRLASFLAECGWIPGDLAAARAMANRAMLPLWTAGRPPPSDDSLERQFLSSLEDQGDRLGFAKARAWLGEIGRRERALRENLPAWRRMQRLAAWTAPGVLACLAAQAALTLAGWLLLAGSVRPGREPPRARWAVGALAFAPAPIAWSVLGWPPGASFLALGLLGSMGLWAWWTSVTPGGFGAARPKLAAAALANLAAFLALAFVAACTLQHQRSVLPALLANGLAAPP